jgi:hypothetical protein
MRVKARARAPSRHWQYPTRDHVEPKSRKPGGRAVICCLRCNNDKRDRTPQEWLVDLTWEWDLRASVVARFIAENCEP